MDKLKPCPFCGGEAEISMAKGNGWFVQCNDCGIGTILYCSDCEAIEAWNRRSGGDSCD